MVVDCYGQVAFGCVLADYVHVEVCFDVGGAGEVVVGEGHLAFVL